MPEPIKVQIVSAASGSGFKDGQQGLAGVEQSAGKARDALGRFTAGAGEAGKAADAAGKSARGFGEALENGFGIGFAERITRGLEEIPRVLAEMVKEGVSFNAEMEAAKYSIAGMIKNFDPSHVHDFSEGLTASGKIIDQLRAKANELGLAFPAMLESYKTTAGAMFHSGVTDIQKQIDLTVLLSQAMKGLNVDGFQAVRDSQDILMGMAERTKAGRELGIKDEDVKAAKEQGGDALVDYLKTKLAASAEAGAAGVHTFNAEVARMNNQLDTLKSTGTIEFFDQIKAALQGVNAELGSPKAAEYARITGSVVAEVAAKLQGLSAGPIGHLLRLDVIDNAVGKLGKGHAQDAAAGAALDMIPALRKEGDENAQLRIREQMLQKIAELQGQIEQHELVNPGVATATIYFLKQAVAGFDEIRGSESAVVLGLEPVSEEMEKAAKKTEKLTEAARKADEAFQSMADDQGAGSAADRVTERKRKFSLAALPAGLTLDDKFDTRDAEQAVRSSGADPAVKAELIKELTEILRLEKEAGAEAAKQGEALEKNMEAQAKIFEKRKEALTDLQSEHAILTAQISGNEALARHLTEQREMEKEIVALKAKGFTEAEATAEATKTMELREQLRLKQQQQTIGETEAANNVAAAELGHSRGKIRDAKVTQERLKTEHELLGKSVDPATARKLADAAGDNLNRQLRRQDHLIGGAAKPSSRDGILSMDDDFTRAFHSGAPISDLVPARPVNAPPAPVAPRAATPDGGGAAQGFQGAAQQQAQAAKILQQAADTAQGAGAGQLSAAQELAAAISELTGNLGPQLEGMRADINRLNSIVSNLGGRSY